MKTVKGNLIKMAKAGDFNLIVHGCNCLNTMGKGIALEIKREFPEAYKADQKTKKGSRSKLGTVSFAAQHDVIIMNAYTQYAYWSKGQPKKVHADYDAIRSCFASIKKGWPGHKVGIPLIGAGLANGDWNKIKGIIEEEMEGEDITLVEFDPRA